MVGLFYMLERSHLPTVYLFLQRLFALRRKRQSMIKLPCNKCNGCVSSSSHRLKSAGALIMQLRPALYLPVAATTSNRVRQMDRRNDTAPLNRKCDHCLRSPHWTHSVSAHWGPHKTSTALAVPADIYTLRASGLTTPKPDSYFLFLIACHLRA